MLLTVRNGGAETPEERSERRGLRRDHLCCESGGGGDLGIEERRFISVALSPNIEAL
ncbi:hypothetical protein ACFUTV_43020 [Streptomyces sp. NPDC057298]|uniref:hypothetical protein n=1 Tax=Streptomyces sp. NPDC057298 TaxID=3346091 RepID=UPI0036452417